MEFTRINTNVVDNFFEKDCALEIIVPEHYTAKCNFYFEIISTQ